MEAISPQGACKEILLLWIALVSHLIDCMEMVSLARSFQIALRVSFANTIIMWLYPALLFGEL